SSPPVTARAPTDAQSRHAAVREALIGAGAHADTLVEKGYGSADPVASNDTVEGRLRNRRIEFYCRKDPLARLMHDGLF
ncbi:MAG: hypothetical protein WBQ45_15150, partial [Roseiarcus sp.]